MKAIVDKSLCIGCDICPSVCPAVFSMGSDGKARAITSPIDSEFEDEVLDAESSCPVNAISVAH